MWGTKTRYAGVEFRSKTEAAWARYFDRQHIPWEYEPVMFHNGAARYTPDFALFGRAVFIEVKGGSWETLNSNMALCYHPDRHTTPSSGHPLIAVNGMPDSCEVLLFGENGWDRPRDSFEIALREAQARVKETGAKQWKSTDPKS